MNDTYTLTRLGWRLLEWTMMGGNYRSLRQLVHESETAEDLGDHIMLTTPLSWKQAIAFAKDVFEPMKSLENKELES